ncbi:MAG: fibronectin type III domain-containing protein [Bacteroidota bacterium]
MFKAKVKFDFIKLPISAKIEFGRNTVLKMQGAGLFTTPDIPYQSVTTICLSLEAAFYAAQGGGKQKTAALHEVENTWNDTMRIQGLYVDRIAKGNPNSILSAGFNTTKQPTQKKIADFTAKCGDHSGEVIIKHRSIKGKISCIWQYCEEEALEDNKWIYSGATVQCTTKLSNLKSNTSYLFRVAFITKDGQGEWTKPIKLYVF